MTLPKGYKKTFNSEKRYRPPQEQLVRLMVDWNMLKIPAYEIDGIENSITNQADKKMKNIEVHPVEWDALIVISHKKARRAWGYT